MTMTDETIPTTYASLAGDAAPSPRLRVPPRRGRRGSIRRQTQRPCGFTRYEREGKGRYVKTSGDPAAPQIITPQ